MLFVLRSCCAAQADVDGEDGKDTASRQPRSNCVRRNGRPGMRWGPRNICLRLLQLEEKAGVVVLRRVAPVSLLMAGSV